MSPTIGPYFIVFRFHFRDQAKIRVKNAISHGKDPRDYQELVLGMTLFQEFGSSPVHWGAGSLHLKTTFVNNKKKKNLKWQKCPSNIKNWLLSSSFSVSFFKGFGYVKVWLND
jgi:hypothetical protein